MKLHLTRASLFTLNTTRALSTLAVAALTASAALLSLMPVRAHAQTTVPLQCQVSTQAGANGVSYTIACNGTLPGGSVALNCQSPSAISDNHGVFTVAGGCSETVTLAGTTIPVNITGTALTIDSNNGTISAAGGTATLSVTNGLASATATCSGAAVSETLSPLTLSNPGACSVATSVLGIGTAQVTGSAGSTVSASGSAVSITSPSFTVSTSVLGLITRVSCGTTVNINLQQVFPITVPLAPCSAL
jgi:hypothetical protein